MPPMAWFVQVRELHRRSLPFVLLPLLITVLRRELPTSPGLVGVQSRSGALDDGGPRRGMARGGPGTGGRPVQCFGSALDVDQWRCC